MNDPTFLRDDSLLRPGEHSPEADWNGGMNRGGSNAPGLGIATDNPGLDESLPSWTLLDQHGNPRDPQQSQHIGQGMADINAADNIADYNDTVSLTSLAAGWVKNAVA